MSLDPNITLMGDLDKYQLSGDAMNAMNTLYARIVKSGAVFLGQFDPDAGDVPLIVATGGGA
jgi:hypothetical protein